MEVLAVAVVPVAIVTQASIAFGRSWRTRIESAPFRVAAIAVAVGCLALLSLVVEFGTPADCAPLSDGRYTTVVAALVVCLTAAGACSLCSLRNPVARYDARVFVGGELAASTGAAVLFGVLAGGTSC